MRILRQIKMWTLLILAAITVSPAAHATTLARLSIEQLAAAADNVARVRCIRSVSQWENEEIWTVTTFAVVESMKGSLPAQVMVRLPGGRVGHLTAVVDGTPKFNVGDDAILFLERSPAAEFSVTAWVEGTFQIERDPATSHETVTQQSSTFAVFDTATRTFRTEGIRRMPIEQFRERLNTALARTQEKSR